MYTTWKIEHKAKDRDEEGVWADDWTDITSVFNPYDPIIRDGLGDIKDTFEFKLTTFEPQDYSISVLQKDANNWVTGSTEILADDISGEQPNATISGTLNISDVFTNVAVGETAMLRLTLTSAQGNTNVAVPWQDVEITE